RVDAPMAEEAVAAGARIGVFATLQSTLGPTTRLIERIASAKGLDREVRAVVCDDAFAALGRGETESHDRMIAERAARLAEEVDVLVLAQASMARVVPGDLPVPVLSSPRSAVRALAAAVERGVSGTA
ncbi:MAG: aspartate/glutamate racemase family protein, partial [Actinomycetota bacterium]|nr:aspartate/glutamate racemase family protein [Actinomycetota bacterium]